MIGCDVQLGTAVEIGGQIRVRLEAWFALFVASVDGESEIWPGIVNTRALLVIGPIAPGISLAWTPGSPEGSVRLGAVLGINY